eukprot:c14731_g1_i1 orf=293-442(+)
MSVHKALGRASTFQPTPRTPRSHLLVPVIGVLGIHGSLEKQATTITKVT